MSIRRLVVASTFVCFMLAPAGAPCAADEPQLSLRADTVRLAAGEDQATAQLLVKGTGLPTPETGDDPHALIVEDLGGEGPEIEVSFSEPEDLGDAASATRYWRVEATIAGIAPESELSRTAKLAVGDVLSLADYTLTNTTSGEFELELTPPPPDLILGTDARSRRTSLVLTTGARPATNVRIVQSNLVDPDTKRLLTSEHLKLTRGSKGSGKSGPSAAVDVGGRTTAELVLEVDQAFSLPGSFEGSLLLAADQSSETKTVQTLTVHNSPWHRRAGGVAALALGLLISVFVGVIAKRRANRLEALRAAAAVRDRLKPLGENLAVADERSPSSVGRLEKAFEEASGKLQESYLETEGLLPPKWYSPVQSAPQASRLEAHLTTVARRVAILDEIIMRGVEMVLEWWEPTKPSKYEDALSQLDQLADCSKELAAIKKEVDKILQNLQQAMRTAGFTGSAPQPASRTTRQLDVELELLGATVWLLWTAVTIASGWVALILTNPGFGTGLDIAACFFWGLGVHLAGESLQQLSPSKIATRFGVQLPEGA